ncbi:MAG TPA: carbamoyltransferase HypF, partial [Caldilineae bacterium]|nr:carbamoyltransferase HypF [Caldilineae bacterium]
EAAIREPRRIALTLLLQTLGELPPDLDVVRRAPAPLRAALPKQIVRGLNAPLTSSCGRLFDAVAALLGVREEVTYEGQAAMELEALAATALPLPDPWPLSWRQPEPGFYELPPETIIRHVVTALRAGEPRTRIAARFHATLIASAQALTRHLRDETGLNQVALSGGCFQNRILLEELAAGLRADGFQVFTHHQVPANDGGLSLGQAVIAAANA